MLVKANKLTAGKPSYKQISYQLLCLVSKAKTSQHTSWQRKNIPDVVSIKVQAAIFNISETSRKM